MSFIALLDGNEVKWKIEKKIKSDEWTRDKRPCYWKKVAGNKRQLFGHNIGKWHDARIRNKSFSASIQADDKASTERTDRHASDKRNDGKQIREQMRASWVVKGIVKVSKCRSLLV